jgi:hypothetical protein
VMAGCRFAGGSGLGGLREEILTAAALGVAAADRSDPRGVAICVAVPDRTGPDWTDDEGRFAVQNRTRVDVAGPDGRASRNC